MLLLLFYHFRGRIVSDESTGKYYQRVGYIHLKQSDNYLPINFIKRFLLIICRLLVIICHSTKLIRFYLTLFDGMRKILIRHRFSVYQGMVQYLDTCVLSFFEENPTGTYVSEPLSSYERLMLHSIAHFYELRSSSKYLYDFFLFQKPFTDATMFFSYIQSETCSKFITEYPLGR